MAFSVPSAVAPEHRQLESRLVDVAVFADRHLAQLHYPFTHQCLEVICMDVSNVRCMPEILKAAKYVAAVTDAYAAIAGGAEILV